MNGVLVVDKPTGPTSHDVVAVARRALGQRGIGHTGTLDPLASGVLPLACGKATRLVRFLSASDKDYTATVRFGIGTDTYDVMGEVLTRSPVRPTLDTLHEALASSVGEHLQAPPAFSAKRVAGRRAYDLARAQQPVTIPPVRVELRACALDRWTGDEAIVSLTCSAGFYVRSFAYELGQRLGTPACLAALRRTRSGGFTAESSVGLDVLADRSWAPGGEAASEVPGWVPMSQLLLDFPAALVDEAALARVAHGQVLETHHLRGTAPAGIPAPPDAEWTRLVAPTGELLGLAKAGPLPGSLHPALVLI